MNNGKATGKRKQSPGVLFILGVMWLILASVIVIMQVASPVQIEIQWETETEFETAGFNIYRSDDPAGEFVRINERLIPSESDAATGATYLYVDESVDRGKTYYYRLEDVEYSNATQQHEILSGQANSIAWWAIVLALISGLAGIMLIANALKQRERHEHRSSTEAVS